MAAKDFDFYAGGIEDGIIEILRPAMTPQPLGVRNLTTYSGELDPDNLKKAIASMPSVFPMVMVSYADGEDSLFAKSSPVLGRPRVYRHECTFVVICADNNPQGERNRRRSKVYSMIAAVRRELTDRRLKKLVGEDVETEEVLLTTEPFEPIANDYIMRMPDITAYAVVFKTAFNWESEDRTGDGIPVTDILVGAESLNEETENAGNLPGVHVSQGEQND
jgi:phage gp37-like protein